MNQDKTFEQVSQIISDYLRLSPGEVTPTSHVMNDLGADSLALAELGFKFMEQFGIEMIAPDDNMLIMSNLVAHIRDNRTRPENP